MKLDNVSITLGGNALTVRKTALDNPFGKQKSISDTYNEFAKLVFFFDVSGSMGERISYTASGQTFNDQFLWPEGKLDEIRLRVAAALAADIAVMMDETGTATLTDEETELCKMADFGTRGFNGELLFTPVDDEDVKARVIKHDLITFFGIVPDFSKRHQVAPTRWNVVKKLAKQEIMNRLKKFPNSRIAVLTFDSGAYIISDDDPQEKLEETLDRMVMNGGGTAIMNALGVGMDVCRAKPSAVGIHHFIMVTDGEDYNANATIGSWVEPMKASGVILDYIHIGDSAVNEGMKAACKALGGEFVSVNCERDLEEKFQLAVARLCLPPVAAK